METYNHKIALFIPQSLNNGEHLPADEQTRETAEVMCRMFGNVSITEGIAQTLADPRNKGSRMQTRKFWRLECYCTLWRLWRYESAVDTMAEVVGETLGEEAIRVEIDGKTHFVTNE